MKLFKSQCFCFLFCLLSVSCIAADTLIFNNSTYTPYAYPQTSSSYTEVLDYGTTFGGRISKFVFRYLSTTSGTVWVRFYESTSDYYPGYEVKAFTISLPSTGGVLANKEYVIPEQDRFYLASGNFGYSFEFTNSNSKLALATGGTGIDEFFWEYDYWWEELVCYNLGVEYNIYFQLYKAPPIDEITCDIKGYKFNDADADGVWDGAEAALPGWDIYLDTNNDGVCQASEPNILTDPNGMYFFENMTSPATYRVREVQKNGWTQTLPGSGANYQYLINTEPNHVYSQFNFGNTTATIVKYGGGSGTQADPYKISTPAHMNEIGLNQADWSKYFILTADLDMSGITGVQYHIIGYYNSSSDYKYFTGNFNGNSHVIRNFSYTAASAKYYVGLFGYTSGASIANLGLENVNVSSAGRYIGSLAGYQSSGSVSNCYVRGGQVAGSNSSQYVGGLAGYQTSVTVSNCRTDVNVNSGTSSSYVGGFAGRAGNLTNCSSVGLVTTGTSSTYVGGLAGSGGTIVSSYWDTQASGKTTGVGTGKTTLQMQTQSTFTGWNFSTVWRICNGMNYPRLLWEPMPAADIVCPEGVELQDVLFIANQWLVTGSSSADIAPATPDGKVNLKDLAELAADWLVGID